MATRRRSGSCVVNNPLFILQSLDLILTKMMRGADPEDLFDIAFLLKHEPVKDAELRAAFDRVRLPDIQELRDAFRAAQPKVLALAKAQGPMRTPS
jgi:hypothetical protein